VPAGADRPGVVSRALLQLLVGIGVGAGIAVLIVPTRRALRIQPVDALKELG
jgi:hypothetical protein